MTFSTSSEHKETLQAQPRPPPFLSPYNCMPTDTLRNREF